MAKNDVLKQSKKLAFKINEKRRDKQHKKNNAKLNKVFNNNTEVNCHWCNEELFRGEGFNKKDNTATVDHIYDIKDIRRFLLTEDENTVIACDKCNTERTNAELYKRKYAFNREEIIILVNLLK